MGALSDFCRRLRGENSGNATLLVALGAPALIGAGGLAIDTAQWYMWKRELQHSVDQAAYAGAWALAREESASTYETRAEQEFDANISKIADFVSEPSITIANYAGGTANSVVVTATASKLLPFSSFLMGGAATVRASAQASFAEGLNYNACLVSLTEEGTGTTIGGSATVKAKCGLAALSCDENAITIDGNAKVTTDSIAACGTVEVPTQNQSVVAENVRGLEDIYRDLVPPDNPTPRKYECSKGKNSQASLLPGTYSSLVAKCTTVLASGIYVIDGGDLDLAGNFDVIGSGVMFVLKNGASIKLGGNGVRTNKINLTPMSASDFIGTPYADQADDLSDILVFEHRDSVAKNPGHKMNGNSRSVIEGLIYLPASNIEIQGNADVTAQCLQISAYTINITGSAELETLCPIDKTTSVGSSIASVKLVR